MNYASKTRMYAKKEAQPNTKPKCPNTNLQSKTNVNTWNHTQPQSSGAHQYHSLHNQSTNRGVSAINTTLETHDMSHNSQYKIIKNTHTRKPWTIKVHITTKEKQPIQTPYVYKHKPPKNHVNNESNTKLTMPKIQQYNNTCPSNF